MVAGTAMVQKHNVIVVTISCRTRVSEPWRSRRPVHSTRRHVGLDDRRVRGTVVLVATVRAC